jgi:glycosyltransferase involved in cell wall biosynthesis
MIHSENVFARTRALLVAWGRDDAGLSTSADARDALVNALEDDHSMGRVWDALAVLRVTFPTGDEVVEFRRSIALMGAREAIERLSPPTNDSIFGETASVNVVPDAVLVDVHTTVHTAGTTGIQRVVRETAKRWVRAGRVVPVVWNQELRAPRLLTEDELDALSEPFFERAEGRASAHTVVIPIRGTYIEPELAVDDWRTDRLAALGQYSSTRLCAIGMDTVPVTSAETAAPPITERFPRYLEALSFASKIAPISEAAATEFRGWRRMLTGAGKAGPEIEAVQLAAEVTVPTPSDIDLARRKLEVGSGERLVLVVGSHEPRKNHLAILYAAEVLWQEGHEFRLGFVGGNAWSSGAFADEVERLTGEGRPVVVVSAPKDNIVAGAYHEASFSVFPSLNEGFGLPVVESLASGTPVISSNFGSMREIAEEYGGVLMVDPRDDASLIDAMRTLLTDAAALASLTEEARHVHPKTWDSYATEVFDYLTR